MQIEDLMKNFSYLRDPRIKINFGVSGKDEGEKLYNDIRTAIEEAAVRGIKHGGETYLIREVSE